MSKHTITIAPTRQHEREWWEGDPDHHEQLSDAQKIEAAREIISQLEAEGATMRSDGRHIVIEADRELPDESRARLMPISPMLFAALEMERVNTTACSNCGHVPAVFGLHPDATPECRSCNWRRHGIPDLPRRESILSESGVILVGDIVPTSKEGAA